MALIQRYEIVQFIFMYISVYTSIYSDTHRCYVQDTVVVVPPYPYCIEEDRLDVDFGGLLVCTSPALFQVLFASKKNSTKAGPGIYMYIHVYVCISWYVRFELLPTR